MTLAVPDSVVPIAQAHLLSIPVVGLPQGRSHAFSSAALDKALQLARDYDAVVLGPGLTLADGAVVTARGLVAKLDAAARHRRRRDSTRSSTRRSSSSSARRPRC